MPPGLNFKSADSAGIAKAGTVSWQLNLKASGKETLHTTMTVSATPKELLRLATVACASVSTKGPPLVCATDSDQLPAGASAQVGKANAAQASHPAVTSTSRSRWYAAGGLGGLVLVMGAFVALMLRRRRTRDPEAGLRAAELTGPDYAGCRDGLPEKVGVWSGQLGAELPMLP